MTARGLWPILFLLAGAVFHPALAGLTRKEIGSAEAAPVIGSQLPLRTEFIDRSGNAVSLAEAIDSRPSILLFADLTCTTLCGVTLRAVADAAGAGGKIGDTFGLVVASIDPKDGPSDAEAFAQAQLGDGALSKQAVFLTGQHVRELARAAGYAYVYDEENDSYAHPAGLYVIGPGGEISRFIAGLDFDASSLESALNGAAAGDRISIASTVRLLCYRYDPVTGKYTLAITRIMTVLGICTAIILLAWVGYLHWRSQKRGVG